MCQVPACHHSSQGKWWSFAPWQKTRTPAPDATRDLCSHWKRRPPELCGYAKNIHDPGLETRSLKQRRKTIWKMNGSESQSLCKGRTWNLFLKLLHLKRKRNFQKSHSHFTPTLEPCFSTLMFNFLLSRFPLETFQSRCLIKTYFQFQWKKFANLLFKRVWMNSQ